MFRWKGRLWVTGPGDSGAEKHFAWQLAIKRDKWEIPWKTPYKWMFSWEHDRRNGWIFIDFPFPPLIMLEGYLCLYRDMEQSPQMICTEIFQ
jgi:hypothetical protein